ncbi:DnaD domain protein [Schinkia azotoformans]|uniref:Primosome subunit n=1 Tax=Schinkia azotoformans LMG 9581 TaxID=1131731 RepID=K6E3P7_SCHAZ|nr:DnaD domain protein [Schinkia azotoformans]EKN67851.1 primosome subunit [Schinkia azotoformans LMG 9581]MEC1637383.1 DnaD domain protein [Schinkia azotoformans]MEC1943787.1 DnaD domain protein [Schinkia azotoformans]
MNYIKLINAFYDRLETNSLSTSAIALWHALVHINNKAGWQREFTVAVSVLCVKTGLSERTISNVRNELRQKNFIDFKSRKGNKSAVYLLEDLTEINAHNVSYKDALSANNADSVSDNLSDNTSDSVSDNPSALIKLNETKRNKITSSSSARDEVHAFYMDNLQIGVTSSPFVFESIDYWIDDLNTELVLAAMKLSAKKEKKGFDYTEGILKRWVEANVKTIEDARRYESSFFNDKKGGKRHGTIKQFPARTSEEESKLREAIERRKRLAKNPGADIDCPY